MLLGNPSHALGAGRQILLPPGAGEHGLRCTIQTEDAQYDAAGQDQVSNTAAEMLEVVKTGTLIRHACRNNEIQGEK